MTTFVENLVWGSMRASLIVAGALMSTVILRRSSAAVRRALLALALTSALVIPVLSFVAPSWQVESPVAAPVVHGREALDRLVQDDATITAAPADMKTTVMTPPRGSTHGSIASWLTLVWALGALTVLVRLSIGVVRASALVRRSRAADVRAWRSPLSRASHAMGVTADIRESDEVDAPAVTGIVRPTVLVPPSLSASDDTRRLVVLLHELAHVRQRDCLFQLVSQLACALHWWNPLVWLAAARLRSEREFAADDAVIASGARASGYAEALLVIAGAARAVPMGALGIGSAQRLCKRVDAVLATERTRSPLGRRGAVLMTGAAAIVTVLVACATASEPTTVAPASSAITAVTPTPATTSIDPRIDQIASEELDRAISEWSGLAGAVVILEPGSGEIRATVGRSHGAPSDVGTRGSYVTGSTLKAITLSGALDDGAVMPTDTFDCEHGSFTYQGQTMHDASSNNGVMSLPEMLAVSSNVGFTKVFDRMAPHRMEHWLRAFHLGQAPAIEGASAGALPAQIEARSYAGAVTAIGEAAVASPLQMAAAYAVIANGGAYVAPTMSRRAGSAPREQIMKPETARVVTTMLEAAVNSERATGKRARIDGVAVAGKTGTASWDLPGGGEGRYASFIGFLPTHAPRYVIAVGIEQPKNEGSGGEVAAPVFARIARRLIAMQ